MSSRGGGKPAAPRYQDILYILSRDILYTPVRSAPPQMSTHRSDPFHCSAQDASFEKRDPKTTELTFTLNTAMSLRKSRPKNGHFLLRYFR